MHCNGCGTDTAISTLSKRKMDENNKPIVGPDGFFVNVETCNECSGLSLAPSRPRDAAGNIVQWDGEARYSVAAGRPIRNASEMAEFCREKNLQQVPDYPDAPEQ